MATLGLTEAERESIERFEKDVIEPSMTAIVILAGAELNSEIARAEAPTPVADEDGLGKPDAGID